MMQTFTAYRLFLDEGLRVPQGRFVRMSEDELSPGDVLIKVAYSSVNYKDALAAAGINKIIRTFPRIGGIDLSGRIVLSSDARFRAGDPVIVHGFGIGVDVDGGHSEFVRVPAAFVFPLPLGLSLLEAATLGAAGYTAALALHWMEHNGLRPSVGDVLISGATGGVASVAIDILAGRGYSVTAMTGKAESHAYLRGLGAREIIDPTLAQTSGKPIEAARWAGALDSVGGDVLSWILRTTMPDGVVTSFGNAGGSDLPTTVLPFILRGVRLIGINANSPMNLRQVVWGKLAAEYRPRHLDTIADQIEFDALPEAMERMRARRTRGRTVIRMAGEAA